MNKEEAIQILTRIMNNNFYGGEVQMACKMAIEAISQPSLPSNLDEAAIISANTVFPITCEGDFDDPCISTSSIIKQNHNGFIKGFKAGAEWMAGQGFSFEDEVYYGGTTPFVKDADFDIIELKDSVKNGDKVIVQIRKAEGE